MAKWPTKIKLEHTFNKVVFIKSKIDCKTKICTLKVLKNIHKIKKIIEKCGIKTRIGQYIK